MSLDLETALRTFLASAPQTVHPIPTLQISHSAMSQVFNIWREPYTGTTSADGFTFAMEPVNFEVKLAGSPGHLDQKFSISISTVDIENEMRNQLDAIPVNTTEKIRIVYREFLSDQLDSPQATATLQAESISYVKGAANIIAVSPRYNVTRTGELFSPKEIPMLRGFL